MYVHWSALLGCGTIHEVDKIKPKLRFMTVGHAYMCNLLV